MIPLGWLLRQQGRRPTGSASSSTSPGRRPACWWRCPTTGGWSSRCSPMTWSASRPRMAGDLPPLRRRTKWAGRWATMARSRVGGRTIRAIACPIGIDDARIRRQRERAGGARRARCDRMARARSGRSLIVGVDRLDYSKGLRGAVPRLSSASSQNASRRARRTGLPAPDRAALARVRCRAIAISARTLERTVGADQRRLCRHRLGADPLRQPGLSARDARRHLSRRPDRAGHAAARRDEPGRQGICRRAGPATIPAC